MNLDEIEWTGFSLLEMDVRDGDGCTNVIFMGRWLADCFSEPSVRFRKGCRYNVALTPTNSYFVFSEQRDSPELRRYEVYDCFEWMEESHEVPQIVLEAVSSALVIGRAGDDEALEA